MARPCLDCGKIAEGTRCPDHQRLVERAKLRSKRTRRPRISTVEERRRARAVDAHRARYGDWCPGWKRPAHASADLTADHVVGVGAGGAEGGQLQVLCRACNGAKQHHSA